MTTFDPDRSDDRLPALGAAEAALPTRTFGEVLVRTLRGLAVQDAVVAAYLCTFLVALAFGEGPGRVASMQRVLVDLGILAVGLVLTRGQILRPGTLAHGLVYRLTIFLAVFVSYFQLRDILPAVSSRAYDATIFAFDERVFGVEPSLAWDRFVNPQTTEWFAFFYFGYFFFLALHILPMMFNAQDERRLAHFSLGIFSVFCASHLLYMVVPGWGPYRFLEARFEHQLEGGLFWGLVKTTVEAGGAQKDIFPSLHTGAPTFFALFSFRYRQKFPFKYTWPLMAFAATQIVGATMFLRWHYLIDIFAGLTVATTSLLVSERVIAWETARRERAGLPPVYQLLPWLRRDEPADRDERDGRDDAETSC